MRMDLNAMALFARVVEYKSFSETARRLGIPISTVSRKVSELEQTLNVRLLERSTRKLRLTELGRDYYAYCRRGLEEFETGTLMIQDKQTEVSGVLRLSAPPNLSDVLLAPMICVFQKQYPKVLVKALITERYLDMIEDSVDITFRVGELKDSNLISREIVQYRHLLVASKSYLTNCEKLGHPKDLPNHKLITFGGWDEQITWKLASRGNSHKIKINAPLCFNDYAGILHAVEQGQGIAEVPSIICHTALQSGRVTEVLSNWRMDTTKLSIVYPSNRNLSRVVRLFIDFCVQYIKEWETDHI